MYRTGERHKDFGRSICKCKGMKEFKLELIVLELM
jgi:hypothetical protein